MTEGRLLTVVYTLRGDRTRIISARSEFRVHQPLLTLVADLERRIGRRLAPAKRGRKRKETTGSASVN